MDFKEALEISKKGQAGGIASAVLTVIFATILLVAVAIPITNDTITDANLSGITLTIVEFIPVFLALAGLSVAAGLIVFGTGGRR